MRATRLAWIVAHALVGWALCFATIGVGMAATTVNNTLIVRAIAAPLFFIGVSWLYFHRFPEAGPLATATEFVALVMAMDFFVVALLILHSLALFASLLGTWIPFALIWAATYLTGWWLVQRPKPASPARPA